MTHPENVPSLRDEIEQLLRTTPSRGWTVDGAVLGGRDQHTAPGHRGHSFYIGCALCQGHTDVLADAILDLLRRRATPADREERLLLPITPHQQADLHARYTRDCDTHGDPTDGDLIDAMLHARPMPSRDEIHAEVARNTDQIATWLVRRVDPSHDPIASVLAGLLKQLGVELRASAADLPAGHATAAGTTAGSDAADPGEPTLTHLARPCQEPDDA